MKYFAALCLGFLAGAIGATLFVYTNPFAAPSKLSPINVSDREQFSLQFSAVAEDSIVFTNDGESRVKPKPDKVLQLWEAPIRETAVMVTLLYNSRGERIGIGTKFSSWSERSNILNGEMLIDSVWHVYLPGQGTMLIEQSENRWRYLRDIVVPAHWNDNWRGNWHGTVTNGPGALGTARMHGGSGKFQGVEAEAIETLTARAYSSASGPVAVDGQITVEFPEQTVDSD